MSVFKRLMQTVEYKAGQEVFFTIKKNLHIRRIQFSTHFYFHLPQNPPVFYPDFYKKVTEISLDGKILKEWDLTVPRGFPKDVVCSVKWGTSSDTAIANPPKIESNSKLLIFAFETIKKEGIDIKSLYADPHEYTFITCPCGEVYREFVEKCKKCGNILTEGEICEKE